MKRDDTIVKSVKTNNFEIKLLEFRIRNCIIFTTSSLF